MQVSNVNNNTIQIKSHGKSSPFKSGTQIKATVTQVNPDGTVLLESDKGATFTASNTSNYGLNPGDTVSLLVTDPSHDGSAATTSITQINGQPIDQNVSLSELHLIDLGVMPNSTNLRLYNILNKFQLPLTKEFIMNLKNIFNKLPGITDEQAAFMAVNKVDPTMENLNALTNVSLIHEDVAALINDSMHQIIHEYGLNHSIVDNILRALNSITAQSQEALNNNPAIAQEHQTIAPDTTVQTENQAAAAVNTSKAAAAGETVNMGEGANNNNNIDAVLQQSTKGQTFISDKTQTLTVMKNYALASMDSSSMPSEAVMNIAPKVADAVMSSLLDKVINSDQVSLKTIGELELPEHLPKDLQQTISALPESAQQEIAQMMPKILQSAKEFLSIKLIQYAEQRLQVPVDKETSGLSLKNNVDDMPSNINSLLTGKGSAAAERAITSLKLSDNTMSFIQIPVVLNDKKTSAEIYVVKRDSSKKLSLENGIKLVFALNTENLGRVESIISANTKDLNLHMRVENTKIKEAVEREISYLKTLLSATSFNLSMLKVTTIDKPVSVLNAHTYFGYKQLDITI